MPTANPILMLAWLLAFIAPVTALDAAAAAEAGGPASFRDFKVYTQSVPDDADSAHIVATMRLINSGQQRLDVRVSLDANAAAGFAGGGLETAIEPGKETPFVFHLRPPDGFTEGVLKGSISFGKAGSPPDRELYVSLLGPDPDDLEDKSGERIQLERITARAQVVGTHAPRTVDAIRALAQSAKPREKDAQEGLELAAGGASRYRIALGPLPAAAGEPPVSLEQWASAPERAPAEIELAEAVGDLQRCIRLMTGAELPVTPGDAPADGPAIRIRLIPAPAEWPHAEAYHLRTDRGAGDVIIEATTAEGLRNGIYGVLTDHLDCHWFMPGTLGEEIPASADRQLRLAAIDEIRSPSFFSNPGMSWGSAPRWDRQNRCVINRGRMSFGHAWRSLIDPAAYPYDKFPDMWARNRQGNILLFDKGWSWTNFCPTSPEVLSIVAEKINAQFDANPDAIVASIDPNDLAPHCQCDRCLAVDRMYGAREEDDKQMADRLLHFSKEIHDRLKPAHQQKYLGILAYAFQTRPPKSAVPHPYHATTVCNFPPYFDHTRPFNDPTSPYNREFLEIVRGWGSIVKQLGFYDYYGHYNFFGPWGILHKIREDLPAFRELGGTYLVIESQPNFGMHGLNLYVAARLAWDLEADVDLLLEEYVTKFYGPAAEPMRAFYRTAERHYALTRPGTQAALRVGRHEAFWQELEARLAEAERRVAGADKRFADRIAFHRDGFTFGRSFFELQARHIPRRGSVENVNAAIAFLREIAPQFERMKSTYAAADPYWPTLVAPYFYPDLAGALDRLEKLAADPDASKNIGEEIDAIGG